MGALPQWLPGARPGPRLRALASAVLQAGAVPRHVAIIMDGNRRYARQRDLAPVDGHALGFAKLQETLEWGLDLGVTIITVYAFSIENFKRAPAEVDGLMALAKDKFAHMLDKSDVVQREGVRVCVLGDITLLPHDVQIVLARAVDSTKTHTRAVLNICFAYTAREEITQAVNRVSNAVAAGRLLATDVTEEVVERTLYTGNLPPPDLLVRTSGETRLSDFMLWQVGYSCLVFRAVLWPDFCFWQFFACVLHYQRQAGAVQRARAAAATRCSAAAAAQDALEAQRRMLSPLDVQKARLARVQAFLIAVDTEREQYIAAMARGCA